MPERCAHITGYVIAALRAGPRVWLGGKPVVFLRRPLQKREFYRNRGPIFFWLNLNKQG
jgi:hypothetical protein